MALMIMSRYTRLRPVQSLKHIFDKQGALGVNTQVVETLVNAVENPASTVATEVDIGSTVGSIFLNVQVSATSTAALANVYMAVMKNPGNNITVPQANVIGVSDNRKHVLHQEMIMTEKNTTSIPRTLFKGVIKLPRSFKRFGIEDQLQLLLLSPGTTYEYCVQCIYKEYR